MKNFYATALLCLFYFISHGQTNIWTKLTAAPSNGGKQDGIFFINKDTGWVVNGSGKIYKTLNGGTSWIQQKSAPGTYFRCVAFANDQIGFAGNIGTNYFPGVTDTEPLYKTVDGGNSWVPVTSSISGTVPLGICAIYVVSTNTNVIYAGGRVGGPATFLKSTDGGNTWTGIDLTAQCNGIQDVYFHSADTGYVFAASDADITAANAVILRTTDGGTTWTKVFNSTRTSENIWKAWFPSRKVGYAAIQSYDAGTTQRYIAKTTDGGLTWTEKNLVNNGTREFGIGFINDSVGWVGGETSGYQTVDGGNTWKPVTLGNYANKFSILRGLNGTYTCYAVGQNVYKISASAISIGVHEVQPEKTNFTIYPNPCTSGNYVSLCVDHLKTKITRSELISASGKTYLLFDTYYSGTSESPFFFKLPQVPAGQYYLRLTGENKSITNHKLVITE